MKSVSEEYASLRVTLESTIRTPAVLVVGGATSEDETGPVACHLSRAFAEAGYRTVVVDPSGGEEIKSQLGLKVPIVAEIDAIPANAVNGAIRNLSAVAISKSAPQTTTSNLKMRSILSDLRAKYDVTIINAGALPGNPAALQFAAAGEGVILGFRFGRKPARADHDVTGTLRRIGATVLGVVAIGRDKDRRPEPAMPQNERPAQPGPEVKIPVPPLPIISTGEVSVNTLAANR